MKLDKSITSTERVSSGLGDARFRFMHGRKAGRDVLVKRETFFIGRNENNDLVLNDRSVSRKHAVMNFLNGKFVLSDLNSLKGVYVNEERTKETDLHHGDKVRLGNVTLEFLEKDSGRPRKTNHALWGIAFVVLVAAVIAFMSFFLGGAKERSPTVDIMREIEYNYSEGIRAYNVSKDVETARMYWQKVMKLDPKEQTDTGHKARVLLESLK